MTSSNALRADEKAEQVAALGAVENPQTATSNVESEREKEVDAPTDERGSHTPSDDEEDVEVGETGQDLEAARSTASTGPYSAFSTQQKRFIVFMVACAGFFSPISANIYFPALNTLSLEMHVSSELINLTMTTYLIFQGLAPTFMGDLADMAGRRPAYIVGFVIYIAANIGLAVQDSYAALMVLRCLQSAGASGTIALGNGVIADISTAAERGKYLGWAISGPMVAPAIGPILGGILAKFLGWRSIFWFLTILIAVFLIPFLISFPETARKVVGDGSMEPQGWNMSLLNYLQVRKARKFQDALTRTTSRASQKQEQAKLAASRKLRWPNPLHTLRILKEKDVALLLFQNSLIYCAFYDVISSAPFLFQDIYNYNDLQIGLCFIPFGVGCFIAQPLNGWLMDWNYRRVARNAGITVDKKRDRSLKDFPIEKARIQVAAPVMFIGAVAVLCYGWVMQIETSLATPLVLQFVVGLCLTGSFNAQSTMLVDLYPLAPSAATAANNLVRCLMGAGATSLIIPMINGMGRGWCFTLIFAILVVTSPIYLVIMRWGPIWRERRRVRQEK